MNFYVERYLNRECLTFDCEVVTPMFLGGADGKRAELRTASIKGMLRFWWRAIYGDNDWKKMLKEENYIFGGTGDKEGKSRVKIFINNDKTKSVLKNLPRGQSFVVHGHPVSIIEYLGYGFYDYDKIKHGNTYHREHISAGSTFTVLYEFSKNSLSDAQVSSLKKAVTAFMKYGNIGSRSRNGFGSFTITDESQANQLLNENLTFNGDKKSWTSFSKESKLFVFPEDRSWEDALSTIGMAYRKARLSLEPLHKYDKRRYVAKPLIVKREHVSINERHAKSYFLHVSKLPSNKYRGEILYLPYLYYEGKNQNDLQEYLDVYETMNNNLGDVKVENIF